jgi:preprotein translocase subunit SecG
VQTYINIALIILAIMLTIAIVLQAHGGLGGAFGGDVTGAYKTRRGLEKTLFQLTIGIAVVFFALVVVNVYLLR